MLFLKECVSNCGEMSYAVCIPDVGGVGGVAERLAYDGVPQQAQLLVTLRGVAVPAACSTK